MGQDGQLAQRKMADTQEPKAPRVRGKPPASLACLDCPKSYPPLVSRRHRRAPALPILPKPVLSEGKASREKATCGIQTVCSGAKKRSVGILAASCLEITTSLFLRASLRRERDREWTFMTPPLLQYLDSSCHQSPQSRRQCARRIVAERSQAEPERM